MQPVCLKCLKTKLNVLCGENFDEDWIQCFTCKDWTHESCKEIDSMPDCYNCDVCVMKKKFLK